MGGTSTVATRSRARRVGRVLLAVAAVLVLVVIVLGWTPLLDGDLAGAPAPAADLGEAQALAADLAERDGADVNPRCHSRVVDHGEVTDDAVVLLHGYTNCPAQFDLVAAAYEEAGVSVVVPRLPSHGLADRLTDELSSLTPAGITEVTDQAVDVAAGLGDRVTVVGLSGGGTAAAWAAATRDDVHEVVLIAPLVVPRVLPPWLVDPVARISRVTPDVHVWWDPDRREELADPPYAYPRFSIRSLGAFLAVGDAASDELDRSEPLEQLVVVVNDNDAAVNNQGVAEIADTLNEVATDRRDHRFAAGDGLQHDLIDPEGENADEIEAIYDVLAEVLELPSLAEVAEQSSPA